MGIMLDPEREKFNQANLIGFRFGKFTVSGLHEKKTKTGLDLWICQCGCGNHKLATSERIYSDIQFGLPGNMMCPDCVTKDRKFYDQMKEIYEERKKYKPETEHKRHNQFNIPGIDREVVHGIYKRWVNMKRRCLNPKCSDYKHYGARGIYVCKEWENSFRSFFDYVSTLDHFNEPGRSLDRIDNDDGYRPCNVRWATKKEQANNTRRTKNARS